MKSLTKTIFDLINLGLRIIFFYSFILIKQHGEVCFYEDNKLILDFELFLMLVMTIYSLIEVIEDYS